MGLPWGTPGARFLNVTWYHRGILSKRAVVTTMLVLSVAVIRTCLVRRLPLPLWISQLFAYGGTIASWKLDVQITIGFSYLKVSVSGTMRHDAWHKRLECTSCLWPWWLRCGAWSDTISKFWVWVFCVLLTRQNLPSKKKISKQLDALSSKCLMGESNLQIS